MVAACGRYKQSDSSPDKTAPPLLGTVRDLSSGFLQENKSKVQPDTIHADTQGQSTAIFGLAFLLGIELMPRIRNWKDQHLFRHTPDVSYEHIDELFSAQVDWDLIATLLPPLASCPVRGWQSDPNPPAQKIAR